MPVEPCAPRCGDGVVDGSAGEICDDGNNVNGDGCSADCKSNEICGNGIIEIEFGGITLLAESRLTMDRSLLRIPLSHFTLRPRPRRRDTSEAGRRQRQA
jgi:cysteine-rich repeat protein